MDFCFSSLLHSFLHISLCLPIRLRPQPSLSSPSLCFSLRLFTFSPHPSNLTTFSLTPSLPSPPSHSLPPTCFHFFLLLPMHISLSPFLVSHTMLFSSYCLLRGNVTPPLMLVHLWFYNSVSRLSPYPNHHLAHTNPRTTIDTRDRRYFENKQVRDRSQHSTWNEAWTSEDRGQRYALQHCIAQKIIERRWKTHFYSYNHKQCWMV